MSDTLDDALGHCYRALGQRDRTSAQLERLLDRRGADPETIGQALDELRRQGYLDDARYARNFVHDRRVLDAWGSERIGERLEAAGVARELIDAALARDGEDGGELASALALLARRLPEAPSDDRGRARALGLLLRKGYESDLAYEAVRRIERNGSVP